MLTKRYIVIFAGLGPEKFTEDVLIKTWEEDVYKRQVLYNA